MILHLRVLTLLAAAGLAFLWTGLAEAATRTWDGGGGADTNWNTAANWSSNSIPGGGDIARFNNTSDNNCTINVNVSVAGIDIQSGYDGTITQSAGKTVTVGTSDFSIAAGTFAGGNSSIDCDDVFSLSGGTFTSTSGTLFIADNFTISGGTFNHNSGTVRMDDTSNKTINIGSAVLNHFIIEKGTGNLTVTGTVDVNGNLTITSAGNINTGTIAVAGNVTANDTAVTGSGTIKFDGTGAQTLSAGGSSGEVPKITIDKASGTLTLQDTIEVTGGWTYTAGTVSAGSSTVKFQTNGQTVDSGSMSFNDVTVELSGNDLTVTGTMDVNGNFTITSVGNISTGTVAVAGNVVSSDTNVAGTGKIKLDGTGSQTVTASSSADFPSGEFIIDKASGTATLASAVVLAPPLTITNGTLSQGASYDLTASGGITLAAGGTLLNTGTGDLTLGGNLSNSGSITLDSNGSGSGTNDILIRSSSTAIRTWSGAGTFTLTDLDVSRMTVGATPGTLTVISGTDSGNNTNWVFSELTPLLHLKMDDGSGTTASDSSGNGYTGTLLGGTTWSSDYAPLTITNTYANSFDGTDDSISVANAGPLSPALAFTFSAWIKADSVSSGTILAKWNAASNKRQYALRLSGGNLVLEVSTNGQSGTVRSVTSGGSITAGTWTHVAALYEADTMKVFIDGSSTSSSVSLASALVSDPLLRIGRDEAGTYFDGLIDDVRLYNRALTDAEISTLAEKDATPPGAPTGLTLAATSDLLGVQATVTAPSDADVSQLIWRYNSADGNTSVSAPSNSTQGTAFGAGVTTGVTASSSQQITATPLTNLKTYAVAVWAKDSAGNIGTSGATASFYLAPPSPRLVITTSGGIVSAQAGSTQTLTITARDGDSNVITSYAGPYSLTWTPTGGSAVTLVSGSTSGWSNGVVTASVTIGGSDAGSGSFQATDNSTNNLTSGQYSFLWYPSSFTVTTASSNQMAGTAFTLTVAAKDLNGATVTRYAGTAALNLIYEVPDSGTKVLSKTSMIPAEFVSGSAAVSVTYMDAGRIKVQAQDTTLVSGVTISGTSGTLIFAPASFRVVLSPLPARLTKVYVGQPFDASVEALASDQSTVTPNYGGTVTLTAQGGGVPQASHAFLPSADRGKFTFTGLKASVPGEAVFTAREGAITGTAAPLGVRAGLLVVNPVQGLPGELKTTAFILDRETNQVVSEDDSTQFRLVLGDPSEGAAATSPAADAPVRVSSGTAALSVTKADAGQVIAHGVTLDFPMQAVQAPMKWIATATQSGSNVTVLQFEQNSVARPPSAAAAATAPSLGSMRRDAFILRPPPPGFQKMDSFRQGPSRFDAPVSMGHTLVAPRPGQNQGQSPAAFGPEGPFMQQFFQGNFPAGWGPSEGIEGGPAWMMGPGGQEVTPWGDTGRDSFKPDLTGQAGGEEKKEETE